MRMIKCFKIIATDVAMSDVTETKTWPEKINDIDKEKFTACKLTEIDRQFTDRRELSQSCDTISCHPVLDESSNA